MPDPRVKPLTPREVDGLLGELHQRLVGEIARNPFPSAARPDAEGGEGGPEESPPRPSDR